MGDTRTLHVAVVGLGFGAEFVPIYLDHPDVAEVSICDANPARLRAVADSLCGGSLTPLLTHLVKQHGTTAEQRQALRQLVDDLSRGKPRGTRRAEGEP